jgi:hypothetical protein
MMDSSILSTGYCNTKITHSNLSQRRRFIVVETFNDIEHHLAEEEVGRMNLFLLHHQQQQHHLVFDSHARENTSDDGSISDFDDSEDFDDSTFDADNGIDYHFDEDMYQESDTSLDADDNDDGHSYTDESLFHDADYAAEKYRYQKSLLSSSSSSSSSQQISCINVTPRVMDGKNSCTTSRRRSRSEYSRRMPLNDELLSSSENPSRTNRQKTHNNDDEDKKEDNVSPLSSSPACKYNDICDENNLDPTHSTCDVSVSADDDSDWW